MAESHNANPDKNAPNSKLEGLSALQTRLNREELKVADLKSENERLRKEQLAEIDAKVKARTDAMISSF